MNGTAYCFEATAGAVGHAEDAVGIVRRIRQLQTWSGAQVMVMAVHIEEMEQFEDGGLFAEWMEIVQSHRWEFLENLHLADCPCF